MGINLPFTTKIKIFLFLILATFLVNAGQAFMTYHANKSAWQQDNLMKEVNNLILEIDNDFDHAHYFMEHFLRTNDREASSQALAMMEESAKKTQQLEQLGVITNNQQLSQLKIGMDAQSQKFQRIQKKYIDIGFIEGSGEYRLIREYILKVEALLVQGRHFELLSSMLELRRHEREFIIGKKFEYLAKFDTEVERSRELLNGLESAADVKNNIGGLFTAYIKGVHVIADNLPNLVKEVDEIQTGFLELEKTSDALEDTLNELYKIHDKNQVSLLFDQFFYSQAVVFVALLFIGFVLGWSQYDVLSSVNRLSYVARKVADGEDCEIVMDRRDEIGKLSYALKNMKDSLLARHNELMSKIAKLEESEKKYAAVIQLAGDPIISLDEELRIISWNRGSEDCFGYNEEKIIGKNITHLVGESNVTELEQAIHATQDDEKFRVIGVEGRFYCKRSNGINFPTSLSLSTWEVDDRRYFTLIVRDISERIDRLQMLERAMDRHSIVSDLLQKSLESIPLKEILAYALDIVLNISWLGLEKKGAIFLYNEASEELELFVQKSLAPALLSMCKSIPLGYCLCGRSAASKKIVMSNNIDDEHDVRFSGMSPHGHYCVPILFNQTLVGVFNVYIPAGHNFDNDEVNLLKNVANTLAGLIYRHKAEQNITKLSRAMEQSPAAILMSDRSGSIEYVNPQFTSLTGYSRDEVIGRNALEFKFGNIEFDKQIFEKIISQGWDWSGEIHSRKKTGEPFWEAISLSPVLDIDQTITNYIIISEDITEKMTLKAAQDHLLTTLDAKVSERTLELNQKIEELETTRHGLIAGEKMASLGRLVAGFAHEINTPVGIGVSTISSIPAFVDKLEKMLEQDEVDEADLNFCLAQIRDSAVLGLSNMRRAADLVTRFKRTSVDQSSESERNFNVRETLNDIIVSLHNTFKKGRIAIELDGPDNLVVSSQPGSLGQIFTNLLMNSFKHGFDNGQREGTIHIRFAVEGSPSNHLHFWYRDNGQGIEDSHLKKLFEPFFTTARESGGSGLGTFIVYNIVTDQLKGKIDVSSVKGEGTLFDFHFPIHETKGMI